MQKLLFLASMSILLNSSFAYAESVTATSQKTQLNIGYSSKFQKSVPEDNGFRHGFDFSMDAPIHENIRLGGSFNSLFINKSGLSGPVSFHVFHMLAPLDIYSKFTYAIPSTNNKLIISTSIALGTNISVRYANIERAGSYKKEFTLGFEGLNAALLPGVQYFFTNNIGMYAQLGPRLFFGLKNEPSFILGEFNIGLSTEF